MKNKKRVRELIDKLDRESNLNEEELTYLIDNIDEESRSYLFTLSGKKRDKYYGKDVYLRGLIEFTNYCKRECKYCGINVFNKGVSRYRLSKEEILSACKHGMKLGFKTFVLQGGEDPYFTDERLVDLIKSIKELAPEVALTLSVGERSFESYKVLKEAGADRFLLRHETSNKELYRWLHPRSKFDTRRDCLLDLKELGYQTGAGFMVGLPWYTTRDYARDLRFLKELEPEMIGIGPFIKHKDTMLNHYNSGELETTLLMLSLVRMLLPKVLLPATTAVSTIAEDGRKRALDIGCNVIMPNLSPEEHRKEYSLYNDKKSSGSEDAEALKLIKEELKSYGYYCSMARGDSKMKGRKKMSENKDMRIDREYILSLLENAKNTTKEEIDRILEKAEEKKGLSHSEIACLLEISDEKQLEKLFEVAGRVKKQVYGNRVVLFAPLYISDYCVNNCVYCGYKCKNKFVRRRLTMDEIRHEVEILENMGHKRLALEAGEDPVNCPIDYVLEALKTIYSTYNNNGDIRRVNVNIAATTVENYKLLKEAEIGTYILFQESYDQEIYEKMHPHCLKGNYDYHTTAFDRAMAAGIDDVGAGVLFGLADPKFEVLGLMMHNEHLEKKFGVGFHTISVPRLRPAEGVSLETFPHLLTDDMFKKIVAIIRLAVPYTGMILSTREDVAMRKELLEYGISQVSAGSCTGVGGYEAAVNGKNTEQFEKADERSPIEVIEDLIDHDYIPSYCTACYRTGRTGEKFMNIAKSEKIHNMCKPNALTTLMEYACDYGDERFLNKTEAFVRRQAATIDREDIRDFVIENIGKLKDGERDMFI